MHPEALFLKFFLLNALSILHKDNDAHLCQLNITLCKNIEFLRT